MRRFFSGALAVALVVACLMPVQAQKKKKLKMPELLENHLRSIGSPERLAEIKSLQAEGKGRLVVLVGEGRVLEGTSMLGSSGNNFRSQIVFDVSDFPGENVSYDGKETYVAQLQAGRRSEIGDFLYQYESILKEGILGGVTTTAWPLYDLKGRRARVRYRGLKKIVNTQLHEVRYQPHRGDSSVQIDLYFDPDTFRHVLTLCRVEVPDAPNFSPLTASASERANASPNVVSTRYLLEERFGDFRDEGGLMLPHVRRVRLTREGQAPNVGLFTAASRDRSMIEWQMEYLNWQVNPSLPEGFFKIY